MVTKDDFAKKIAKIKQLMAQRSGKYYFLSSV